MNMKKKLVAGGLVACMGATLIGGATLAYFTDKDEADNVFTVGNVGIDLTEPNWDATGANDAKEAYPGEPLAKDPTVTNTGANPCVVRIKVEWDAEIGPMEYRTDYQANRLGDNWVDGGDGYFYYTKALDKGDVTDALFDQIVVPTTLTNDDATTEYNVKVTAYAAQAQGIFTSYKDMEDGISAEELPTVQAFFNTAFAPAP